MEPDLFSCLAYPNQPGSRRTRTSRAAAKAVAPKAPTLRDRVLELMKVAGFTADEAAIHLKASPFSVRPRVAELHKMGLIYDTGQSHFNSSGLLATVWMAV